MHFVFVVEVVFMFISLIMHINQVKNIEKYSREEFKYTRFKTLKNTAKSN